MVQAFSHQDFMELALDHAKKNNTLYAAVITMGNDVVEVCHNRVKEKSDPTAHAEMEVLREVSKLTRKTDLSGYTLYTTVEPCPMCASACVWSNIGTINYGLSIDDVSDHYPQIAIPSSKIIAAGFNKIELHSGLLHEKCLSHLKSYI